MLPKIKLNAFTILDVLVGSITLLFVISIGLMSVSFLNERFVEIKDLLKLRAEHEMTRSQLIYDFHHADSISVTDNEYIIFHSGLEAIKYSPLNRSMVVRSNILTYDTLSLNSGISVLTDPDLNENRIILDFGNANLMPLELKLR